MIGIKAGWIGPLLLIGLGASATFLVVRDTLLIVESSDWVASDATVHRAWLKKSRRKASPRVEYRYTVNGIDYVGSRLEIPCHEYNEGYARRRLAPYAPGTAIRILYDPDDPAESVIEEPSVNWFFTLGIGGLSLALLAGGTLGLLGHSSSRRARSKRAVRSTETSD